MEAYIDDMVVKTKEETENLSELGDIFAILRKHKLRLSASKCLFGVGLGKSLGYMINHHGIELLHKWKDFTWFEECDRAFVELKAYLAHPLILSRPEMKDVLYAYVAVARHVVSLVLVRVDGGVQKPMYYVSKSLQKTKALLKKSDYIGRVAKWGAMLRAFNVKYMPGTVVNGQVLADLVAEFDEELGSSEVGERLEGFAHVETVVTQYSWQLFVDGAANKKRSRIGIVMVSPDDITLEKSFRLGFLATNNEAEYEALLVGLNTVQKLGGKTVRAYCDSRLVVGQILGEYEAKYLRMLCREDLPRIVLVESYITPAYNELPSVTVNFTRVGPDWQIPLVALLKDGIVPEDRVEAEKVRRKAPRFRLSEDQKLYKRSYSGPYLLCVHPEVIEMLLEELHEGICGSHIGGKSFAHRALT
ncbi:uncharacterized protein LOC142634446 [Castanea sativa]|uniref:uncharacterized protein LOC142634446 n=1 Tax=Castanea sativa TaxID=21020 RepID=UPI003F650C09